MLRCKKKLQFAKPAIKNYSMKKSTAKNVNLKMMFMKYQRNVKTAISTKSSQQFRKVQIRESCLGCSKNAPHAKAQRIAHYTH